MADTARFVVTSYNSEGFKQSMNRAMAGIARLHAAVSKATHTFAELNDATKARNAFIADGGDVRELLAIEEMFGVVHE